VVQASRLFLFLIEEHCTTLKKMPAMVLAFHKGCGPWPSKQKIPPEGGTPNAVL
jgi:hypothetical protein